MSGAERMPIGDPLRDVRRAIHGGRFREASAALADLPGRVRASAEAQLLAAMTEWRLGDYGASRAAAQAAREAFRAIGDADGEMRAVNVAAAGAFAVGELESAQEGFHRALTLADEMDDQLMTAHCANNLGNVAYFLERHYVALGLYRLAGTTFERLGAEPGLIMTWINQTVVWTELGDLDAAREAADHAVEIAEREGTRRLAGAALTARAEAAVDQGDLALAEAQAQRGLVLARAEHDQPGEAEALRVLARVARLQGRPERAESLGREAVTVALQVGDRWREAEAQRELAALYEMQGRVGQAHAAFTAAARAFAALGATKRAERQEQRATELTR
jgi:tetratricopeptide (TPR) repeat protein